MKGEYCADHETAVYGRPVLVLRDDPLIILSDYTEYKITVPEVIFGKGRTCEFIKVALVRDNDGLSLMLKSGKKEECIKLDESIYCEVEKNE